MSDTELLVDIFFSFNVVNILCHCLWPPRFQRRKWLLILSGIPLCDESLLSCYFQDSLSCFLTVRLECFLVWIFSSLFYLEFLEFIRCVCLCSSSNLEVLFCCFFKYFSSSFFSFSDFHKAYVGLDGVP